MRTLIKKKYEDRLVNYILLALTCMNFMKNGSIVLLLFCIYTFMQIETKLSKQGVVLLLLSLAMLPAIWVGDFVNKLNETIKTVNYCLPFIVGYNGYLCAEDKEKYVRRVLFTLFAGFTFYITMMYFRNLDNNSSARMLYNIWDGRRIAVTLIGLISSFIIAYSIGAVLYLKNIKIKLLCIIAMFFVVAINMQTATRTPFILMAIIAAVMFLCSFNQSNYKKRGRYILTALIVALILAFVYATNLFGVKDVILSSPLVERFIEKGMDTGRIDIAKLYFENMLRYPWGGQNVYWLYGRTAHNIWQQCYDIYGVFAAVFMLLITLSMLGMFIKLLFIKDKQDIDYIFLAVYLGVLLQMSLEPIMTGYPILFWIMLFVHGIAVIRYNFKNRSEVEHI